MKNINLLSKLLKELDEKNTINKKRGPKKNRLYEVTEVNEENEENEVNEENGLNENIKEYNDKIQSYQNRNYNIESNINNCIEYINDNKYDIHSQEIEYKILDDISYIIKNKDSIELIVNISNKCDFLSINKIRLSQKINNYIKDIYVKQNTEIILTKDKLLNIKTKDINNIIKFSNEKLNLHIIIEPNNLNNIINSHIYILFTYINFRNKVKYY